MKKRSNEEKDAMRNNCIAFMFDEIRYELNGVEIDHNKNFGITSTIENYVSLTYDKAIILPNTGWDIRTIGSSLPQGHINFCVPLNMLLNLCEDY